MFLKIKNYKANMNKNNKRNIVFKIKNYKANMNNNNNK